MAQTVAEIQAEMATAQAAQSDLAPLNSESSTAIYVLWQFIMAQIIVYFQQIMDLFKTQITTIINSNQYGTPNWWYNQMLAFQYGDTLVFINNVFQYAAVNTALQIINYCSITSLNGLVQIKVATSSGGSPAPLTTDQLNGVVAYASEIQPSGIRFSVISIAADLVQFYGNIYYDASGNLATIQAAVIAAINTFLNNNQGANFNGALYVNSLIAAIEAVPGLLGNKLDVSSIAAKNGGSGYTTFTSSYQPESGYFQIDPAFPLASTLTFIPFVA